MDSEALRQDVELYPDVYHYERAARFGMTEGGIRHVLKRLGISRKKTLKHPKANPEASLPRQNDFLSANLVGVHIIGMLKDALMSSGLCSNFVY
ncbi:IS630 transposase-related protein [Beggiatoa leptomitoformis]|uniref:IS630 transposase-related protein n=1 Tax=Beggiatoa leptomitoformis TaxID=288004 RepID=UPI0039C89E34